MILRVVECIVLVIDGGDMSVKERLFIVVD